MIQLQESTAPSGLILSTKKVLVRYTLLPLSYSLKTALLNFNVESYKNLLSN